MQENIKGAIEILRSELMKHGDLYNGFLASIVSVVEPISFGLLDVDVFMNTEAVSEKILKRIIGEE